MNWKSVIWISKTTYIDIDTGEVIEKRTKEETRQEIKNKYIIIKIIKHAETEKHRPRGTIEYTIKCKRNPQGELF